MAKRKKYRVIDDTSVRKSKDPDDPEFEEWIEFVAGEVATDWPAHADVKGWVASGHWQPVTGRRAN